MLRLIKIIRSIRLMIILMKIIPIPILLKQNKIEKVEDQIFYSSLIMILIKLIIDI